MNPSDEALRNGHLCIQMGLPSFLNIFFCNPVEYGYFFCMQDGGVVDQGHN